MSPHHPSTRRQFLHAAALGGAVLALGRSAASAPPATQPMPPVTPPEDLMREHGVLKRLLLVYCEALRRMDQQQDLPPAPLHQAAGLIRSFIEDYHEKLEETELFPRFEKAGQLVDLVRVLRQQHQRGRDMTGIVLRLSTAQGLRDLPQQARLTAAMRQFIRMYEPHEAREDTVLFPALRQIVSPQEFHDMAENFERQEHQLFGADGFEKVVDQVAAIEKTLGIYDLSRFTPTL